LTILKEILSNIFVFKNYSRKLKGQRLVGKLHSKSLERFRFIPVGISGQKLCKKFQADNLPRARAIARQTYHRNSRVWTLPREFTKVEELFKTSWYVKFCGSHVEVVVVSEKCSLI